MVPPNRRPLFIAAPLLAALSACSSADPNAWDDFGQLNQELAPLSNRADTLAYLDGLPSESGRVLTGLFGGYSADTFSTGSGSEYEAVNFQTQDYPAVLGCDYMNWNFTTVENTIDTSCNAGLIAHAQAGGLVTISVHFASPEFDSYPAMFDPSDGGSVKADMSTDVLKRVNDENTTEGQRWRAMLDKVAAGLAELDSAGVTVLFRPLHEMNLETFWWGVRMVDYNEPWDLDRAEEFKKLWRDMHAYITARGPNGQPLDNLLWVYTPDSYRNNVKDAYPDDQFVDIVGLDHYRPTPAHIGDGWVNTVEQQYNLMLEFGKPFAFTEVGPPSALVGQYDYSAWPAALATVFTQTSYITTWNGQWRPLANVNGTTFYEDPVMWNRSEVDMTNPPPPPPGPSGGDVTAEAEGGALVGVTTSTSVGGYTGSGHIFGDSFAGGDKVTVTVDAAQAGSYPVIVRYAIPGNWGDKKNTVKVNGTGGELDFPSTGGSWVDRTVGTFSFAQGSNTVSIEATWGWMHIDSITVQGAGSSGCSIDADCDDGIACTTDACNSGSCEHSPDNMLCSDGNFCTGTEICNTSTGCEAGAAPCGGATPECDETVDTCFECLNDGHCGVNEECQSGACVFTGCLNDAECDDGVFCNGSEICNAGSCEAGSTPCGGTTSECDESASACVECLNDGHCGPAETCSSNVCVELGCSNDAECDDGNFCNGSETCSAGDCVNGSTPCGGSTPICEESLDDCYECLNDGHCGANEACAMGTCVFDGCASDTECDDGLFCNGAEVCNAGSCEAGGTPCGGATPICSESSTSCVECVVSSDCGTAEVCENNACVAGPVGTNPCAGLCENPTVIQQLSWQSGNLGVGPSCYEWVGNVYGGNFGNFDGRTLYVNGVAQSGNQIVFPAKRNGGYCFDVTSGNYSWAYMGVW